jgi:hypothetical protein
MQSFYPPQTCNFTVHFTKLMQAEYAGTSPPEICKVTALSEASTGLVCRVPPHQYSVNLTAFVQSNAGPLFSHSSPPSPCKLHLHSSKVNAGPIVWLRYPPLIVFRLGRVRLSPYFGLNLHTLSFCMWASNRPAVRLEGDAISEPVQEANGGCGPPFSAQMCIKSHLSRDASECFAVNGANFQWCVNVEEDK